MPVKTPVQPLSAYVENGPLTTEQLTALAKALAEALCAAHLDGAWHGDLSPANVRWDGARLVELRSPRGRLDLDGLAVDPARLAGAEARSVLGYLAPEQCGPGDPGPRSDVFAAGVLLYEAATGEHPFDDPRGDQLVANILVHEPRPAGQARENLPLEWDAILSCCLHKAPAERYASAFDLLRDLEALERSGGTQRRKHRTVRWGRVAVVLVVAVLLMAALLAMLANG